MNLIDTDPIDLDQLADRMLRDYDARTPGTVFEDGQRLAIEDAWRLQDAVARRREQRGEQVVGYKIGCVCPENRKNNGLQHPVSGRLWSTEQYFDGARLLKNGFANVAVEAEFAVTLKHDIDHRDLSLATISAAVDTIRPVIELHNLVFRGGDPKGSELIANNAIHSGVVHGVGCSNPEGAAVTDLSIHFAGRLVDTWPEIRWPDDILQAVGWLANRLQQSGQHLQREQLILTGAFGPPLPVAEASHVSITSSRFGTAEVWFDETDKPGENGKLQTSLTRT
ncbi:MAG: hypothetical protein ABGZ35_13960 [Planctomycetaceae bacterium]